MNRKLRDLLEGEEIMKKNEVKKVVREGYARVAAEGISCCGPQSPCCGTTDVAKDMSKKIGYTDDDLQSVPEESNLGLGCGNPVALASLKEGETVLDLGSGAGLDCFLAAKKVGKAGKVIGVDMTPEMVEKARKNARKSNYDNVEFRLGEIENLPVADSHVDVIISNCVINLSPDKERVFKEAFRVLKPGGRLMVSDIVLVDELPDSIKGSVAAYISCLAGAAMKDDYIRAIESAGFKQISIVDEKSFPAGYTSSDPTVQRLIRNSGIPRADLKKLKSSVRSISIHAVKPKK